MIVDEIALEAGITLFQARKAGAALVDAETFARQARATPESPFGQLLTRTRALCAS